MKIINKLYIILMFSIFILGLTMGMASAIDNLAPVKKGECINIVQTCATCTYNNLSVIRYPNNGTYALNGDYVMTKQGSVYNYTFCNTTQYGEYFVDGYGDLGGVKTGWGGFTFIVNGSGQSISSSQITLLLITVGVMLIMALFFFVLSIILQHPGSKIFLMALSTITLILLIGIIASSTRIYLSEFNNLSNVYNAYYIASIALAGASMLGIIVWFIYYSLTLFNKSRGKIPEDD